MSKATLLTTWANAPKQIQLNGSSSSYFTTSKPSPHTAIVSTTAKVTAPSSVHARIQTEWQRAFPHLANSQKIANESPYRGHISSTYQGNSSTLPCTTRETSTNQSISSSLTKPGKQILKNRTNSTNRETRQCLTLQSYILKMSTCISHHFSTHRVALVLNTGEHCPWRAQIKWRWPKC